MSAWERGGRRLIPQPRPSSPAESRRAWSLAAIIIIVGLLAAVVIFSRSCGLEGLHGQGSAASHFPEMQVRTGVSVSVDLAIGAHPAFTEHLT